MSDFEDDIDDQLLELAGATGSEKKKRRLPSAGGGAGNASGKKRKAEVDMDSDRDPVESEEEMEDPYPFEGKYKDDADKRELLSMTEIRREQILEERAEEKQRLQNSRQIADLVRQQRSGTTNNEESVSRAAKRQHTTRGATKEKASKLDELKAKRKAKDEKKRSMADGSQQRERSSSPQDMDISDSESEDGQISKQELEEERLLSLGGYKKSSKEEEVETPCTMADLEKCRLTRELIVKHHVKPWFEDYVKGAWVRYLIGHEPEGGPVYRICQISNLAPDFVKPYKVDGKILNQAFELKHGRSMRLFNMDKVSNGTFVEKEFDRLLKVCSAEDVKVPTKQDLEKKAGEMQKLVAQPMTEGDISAMLARKSQLQVGNREGMSMLERSRLMQERTLALRRQDYEEVTEIDAKLEEARSASPVKRHDSSVDLLAKVNERNRKANVEAVRRAEIAETERKRRERKLAGRPTPTPTPTPAGSSTFEETIHSVEIDLGDF